MHCNCESAYEEHDLVECITSALDARDPYTGNHYRRVADMACDLCHVLGLPEDITREIHIAGHLHDIGKIGIPDKVLLKPGRLNDEEWELMKQHPKIGADILAGAPKFARIAAIILHHHERFDGKGYPFGAKGRGNTAWLEDNCGMRFHRRYGEQQSVSGARFRWKRCGARSRKIPG